MQSFDLISDIHATQEDPGLTWPDFVPSRICVVAGDLVEPGSDLRGTLDRLRQIYEQVIFVDGNSEHQGRFTELGRSYQDLQEIMGTCPGVTWLYDNMVVIDDVAFLGTNGWFSFNADARFSYSESAQLVAQRYGLDATVADSMLIQSIVDARYLQSSMRRLQRYPDIRRIVLVTHSVPDINLVEDPDLRDTVRINTTINTALRDCLAEDTEHKIRVWCFGHLHQAVDTLRDNVRYVCNPRGRPGTEWFRTGYRPQRIDI